MTNSVNNTELNKESTTTKEEIKTTQETLTDTSHLEFYDNNKKPEETKPEETKKSEETKPEEKTKTGYEDEEVKTGYNEEETKKPEETKKSEETKPDELSEVLKGLPETIDKEKVLKFAQDHKLTKEQLAAYTNMVNEEEKNSKANQEAQVLAVRKQYKEELYKDPTFGASSKETFDKNIHEVEKILNNHMPNMKKALTDKGGMLPPYVMKDLLGISKLLNPKTNLVNGDPSKIESKEKNFLDEMYV